MGAIETLGAQLTFFETFFGGHELGQAQEANLSSVTSILTSDGHLTYFEGLGDGCN